MINNLSAEETMKKIFVIFSILFLTALAVPAAALALGLEIAGGAWMQSPSGTLAYEALDPARDLLDLENDLNYEDETRFFGRLNIDMPAIIPNIYLMVTPMEFEGNGSKSFYFGGTPISGSFYSKLTLNHADIALYYGIPGLETLTVDMLNIDIGLNVRIYDIDVQLTQPGVDVSESITVPIPQVYLALQFRPTDFLAIEAEGRGISISGNKAYSLIGRLRFNILGPFFLTGGYRYDKIDIDEEGVIIDTDFSGPFAEAGLAF